MTLKRIFISAAKPDLKTAQKLYRDLKAAGWNPWLEKKDLRPGQNREIEIKKAMRASDYVLIVLSKKCITTRGHVQKEQKIALDMLDEFPPGEIFTIPVRIDDCQPIDERLRDIQAVDLFPSYFDGLNKLLTSLKHNEKEHLFENKPVHMLHLSDLHLGTPDDARLWAGQLADDLVQELGCRVLHAVILSGDIANTAATAEYDAAREFIDRFCPDFSVDPDRLVIVPGNHDLDWKLARKGYQLTDVEDIKEDLIDGRFIRESPSVVRIQGDR